MASAARSCTPGGPPGAGFGLHLPRLVDRRPAAQAPLFSHSRPQLDELAALVEERRIPGESFVLPRATPRRGLPDRARRRAHPALDALRDLRPRRLTGDLFGQLRRLLGPLRRRLGELREPAARLRSGAARAPPRRRPQARHRLLLDLLAQPVDQAAPHQRQAHPLLRARAGETRRAAADDKVPSGGFRVDLRTKRDLFSEQLLSSLEINLLSTLSKERQLHPASAVPGRRPGDAMYVVLEARAHQQAHPGAGEEALAILGARRLLRRDGVIDRQPRSPRPRPTTATRSCSRSRRWWSASSSTCTRSRRAAAAHPVRLGRRPPARDRRQAGRLYILAGGDVPEVR